MKPYTKEEFDEINNKLQKQLGPEYVSYRNGPSVRLAYISGSVAISLANEIFGFNGWSTEIKSITTDFVDVTESDKYNIGVSVIMRITLKDGTFHEDIGYGTSENARSKASGLEKAKKQAVTDATKRALHNFGNATGGCLYDHGYLNNISKMGRPQVKFEPGNLYRHSQYAPAPSPPASAPTPAPAQAPSSTSPPASRQVKPYHAPSHLEKPIPQNYCPPSFSDNKFSVMGPSTNNTRSNSSNNNKQTHISEAARHQEQLRQQQQRKEQVKIKEENLDPRPILMAEDSFSYEGDEEFFALMANQTGAIEDEFANLEQEDLEVLVSHEKAASQASNHSTAPESSAGVQRLPSTLSDPPQNLPSNKRIRLDSF